MQPELLSWHAGDESPFGGGPRWIPVLDFEDEQGSVFGGHKEEAVIMTQAEPGDAGGAASVLLELACQRVLVCTYAPCLRSRKHHSAACNMKCHRIMRLNDPMSSGYSSQTLFAICHRSCESREMTCHRLPWLDDQVCIHRDCLPFAKGTASPDAGAGLMSNNRGPWWP